MLTSKENLLETIKPNGKPDRLVNQYNPHALITSDPAYKFVRGNRVKGSVSKDRWGTTIVWPEDQFAPMPHITDDDKVLPEITEWRSYVTVPDIVKACCSSALWEPVFEEVAKVNRDKKVILGLMGTGCFEQMHHLMGFEDTLVNLLIEPEAMLELAETIGEFRFQYTKLLVDYLKPDMILSHDDWGSKTNLFMAPETWRTIIKPQYVKMYKYMKDHGVLIMHHSDSFCEPIVEDMVELGIDIWQGVLPTNDILKLQKQLNGRMTLMGGIDSVIDRADATEEEIRIETRRVCETYGRGGHFIPSLTYGGPGSMFPHVEPIMADEIEKFNKEVFGVSE